MLQGKMKRPPIIFIGMHRSGTTMVPDMLRDLGLFIGWELENHNEPIFFLNRNNKILNACNGGWDNPAMVEALLSCREMRKKVTERLKKDINSPRFISYLGLRRYVLNKSVSNINFPWGWKDPRNTILLPLWLDVFPDAKIIHVYRNGVDVAQSLSTREKRRVEIITQGKDDIAERISRQSRLMNKRGISNYAMLQIRRMLKKSSPLVRYADYRVHPCISIEWAFELWCFYIEKAFGFTKEKGDQVIHIKYEDILSQPEHYLTKLNDYCGLSNRNETIKAVAQNVNTERKYAFKGSKLLSDFYEDKKGNYWMQRLGYAEI